MADQAIAFHYHTYGISSADYEAIPSLKSFFKVLSTDRTEKGIKFLTAMESYEYPIYAIMYHPEYQMLEYLSQTTLNTIDNKDTIDIIEHLGHFIYS